MKNDTYIKTKYYANKNTINFNYGQMFGLSQVEQKFYEFEQG